MNREEAAKLEILKEIMLDREREIEKLQGVVTALTEERNKLQENRDFLRVVLEEQYADPLYPLPANEALGPYETWPSRTLPLSAYVTHQARITQRIR